MTSVDVAELSAKRLYHCVGDEVGRRKPREQRQAVERRCNWRRESCYYSTVFSGIKSTPVQILRTTCEMARDSRIIYLELLRTLYPIHM